MPRSVTAPSPPLASTCTPGPQRAPAAFWRSEKVEILLFLHLGARPLGAKDRYFAEPRMESSWFPPSTLPRVSSFPYLWVCSYTYGSVVIRILCGIYWFEVVNHHIMGKLQPELANGKGLLNSLIFLLSPNCRYRCLVLVRSSSGFRGTTGDDHIESRADQLGSFGRHPQRGVLLLGWRWRLLSDSRICCCRHNLYPPFRQEPTWGAKWGETGKRRTETAQVKLLRVCLIIGSAPRAVMTV
jgi:hypothetical protein